MEQVRTSAQEVYSQFRSVVDAVYKRAEQDARVESEEPDRLLMGLEEDQKITKAIGHVLASTARRMDGVPERIAERDSEFYKEVLERLETLNSLLDESINLKKRKAAAEKEEKLEGKGQPVREEQKEGEKRDRPIAAMGLSFVAGFVGELIRNWVEDNLTPIMESINNFIQGTREVFDRIFNFFGVDLSSGVEPDTRQRTESEGAQPFRDLRDGNGDEQEDAPGREVLAQPDQPIRASGSSESNVSFIPRPAHTGSVTRTGATPNTAEGRGSFGRVNELTPEAMALLDAISVPESGGEYNVIVGQGRGGGTLTADDVALNAARMSALGIEGDPSNPPSHFSNYSEHPGITGIRTPHGRSTAAGRYQIVQSTWDAHSARYGLADFSPESQDKFAWYYAQEAYQEATGQDLQSALQLADTAQELNSIARVLNQKWTSLIGGVEEQGRHIFSENYQTSLQHHNRLSAMSGLLSRGFSERSAPRQTSTEQRRIPITAGTVFASTGGMALGAAVGVAQIAGGGIANMLRRDQGGQTQVAVSNQSSGQTSTSAIATQPVEQIPAFGASNPHARNAHFYGMFSSIPAQ